MAEPGPAAAALRRALAWQVRHGLRGVWLRGRPPAGPFVWAANHHSWWDPFVAMGLLHRLGRRTCLLMDQQNLRRYALARPLGAFGTAEHRRGLAYLDAGRVLVIYPEGELRPAGPPGPLAGGAEWFAHRTRVPLYAAATRVVLRGEQAPEAYVWLAPVDGGDTATLAGQLRDRLAELDQLCAGSDPRRPLPGFARMIAGQRSWDERIELVRATARRWPWRR